MDERQLKNYKRYTLVLLLVTTGALVVCAAAFSFKRAAQGQNVKPQAVVTEHYTPKQAASQETLPRKKPPRQRRPRPASRNTMWASIKAGWACSRQGREPLSC